jgi:sugar lactone lactonase YvrE
MYVVDSMNYVIRRIPLDSKFVDTFAGAVNASGSIDGTGLAARFKNPDSITTDGTNLYMSDSGNHTIRKIEISGTNAGKVTTIAGQAGVSGFANDADGITVTSTNPVTNGIIDSTFSWPDGITTDGTNLYVCDSGYHIIRKIEISSGIVTTIAGQAGNHVFADDADGTTVTSTNPVTNGIIDSTFYNPQGITTDGTNLYMTDSYSYTIRKIVISSGVVSTIAGAAGSPGQADDPDGTTNSIASRFDQPTGVATDGTNLYVCDTYNHTIRKIVISSGVVSTIAGLADSSGSADDPDGIANGIASRFNYPRGIATDGINLLVSDSTNHTIRKIVISTGAVTTIAGTPAIAGNTDGYGSTAVFRSPAGIALYGDKILYICDKGNNAIRVINP